VTVTRENPTGGDPLTTTEIPADATKPILVTNSSGEKIQLQGENIDVKSNTGERLFDFNTETGLKTDNMLVDRDGMTDLDSGVTASDGEFVGGLTDGDEFFGGEDCEDCEEAEQNEATSDKTTSQVVKLCQSVTMAISSGDTQAALRVGTAALAVANGALSSVGNDAFAAITISHALGNLKALMAQAGSNAANAPSSLNTGRDRMVA